jgi:hypothetical protein
MNNFNCDEIRRTLSIGGDLLDVRTTGEFNKGQQSDVTKLDDNHHYQQCH